MQETINFLEEDANEAKEKLERKEAEIRTLREKSSNSEIFADEISLLKDQVETLEQEKDVLYSQLQTANDSHAAQGDQNLVSQIEFLNSIIADNQEKLKIKDAEIKELEKLIVAGAVTEVEQDYIAFRFMSCNNFIFE